MKKYSILVFWLLVNLFLLGSSFAQTNIAVWTYDGLSGTSPTSYPANVGSGTSSVIGAIVPVAAATGMDPIINNGCGNQNGSNPGAWSFTANPGTSNESSGVQYNVSTLGYQNIQFTWDQRSSNTATNTVRIAYTLNGATWTNFNLAGTNTTFCTGSINTNGCFEANTTGDVYRRISVNFSSVVGANNNPNFGVRILAAHFQGTTDFRQVSNTSNLATAGTWRFDNVTFSGASPDISILSANNFVQVAENIGTINVPINVSNANPNPINLTFGLSTYSNATENSDFTWTNTLSIPAATNGTFNLPITIIDDNSPEKAERIIVKILSGTNANISVLNNYQIIFIKDNDYVAPVANNELNFNLLTSFSNGPAGTNSAEIVKYDSSGHRLYVANSVGAKLDIYNFSNPALPVLINSISMTPYGNINSLTAHNGVVALAIESIPAQGNGKVVILDSNGVFISQVNVGPMPDMITFNKNFTKLLTANEGEPNANYSIDPEGSVSIIDVTNGFSSLTNANVNTLSLSIFNGQQTALLAQGIRIFSTSASVAQDLEPEYIAISDNNAYAYVTLQENNALLTIDLQADTILSIKALGYSSYAAGSGNALDASDQSGAVLITGDLPIKGAYMPDAIDFSTIAGQGYLFTANEGDSREFGSVVDANRISSSTFNNLDSTIFPDQHILKNNKFLGRLSALKYSGDTDGDGDFDELHVMGGRSFSIWDPATGNLVYDSKDIIEQIIASHPTFGAIFNASNSIGTPVAKNRSDDKGPEPEGIVVQKINGKTYAFLSLERIGGCMIFNVSNPISPIYVGYANNRSATASGPDLGAEGIIFIPAEESPNGNNLVLLANEVSSTISVYEISTCAEISGGIIQALDSTICVGQSQVLTVNELPNVSYQWLLNNQILVGEINDSLSATLGGDYSILVNNSAIACTDTSKLFTLVQNTLPSVFAGTNQLICDQSSVALLASGDSALYSWDNGVVNGVPFVQVGDTVLYTVTATDSNNCTNTAQVTVILLPLPVVNAGMDQAICEGLTIVLSATGDSANYTWDNGIVNGVAFLQTMDSVVYTVTAVDTNNCVNTDQVWVQIKPLPQVYAGNDTLLCTNHFPYLLNATGTGTIYSWNTGQMGSQISILTGGLYIATGVGSNGCSNADSILISENACLSLEENNFDFKIYPNPTRGMVTIELTNFSTAEMEIMNSTGQIIVQQQLNHALVQIPMGEFGPGVYYIRIKNQEAYTVKRIIVD